ncbi:unnamed protein product, partial [Polarella glacialis]
MIRRLFQRVVNVSEWYEELDISEKLLLYMAAGMYWGTCYGTYIRRGKLEMPTSDFLMASAYMVPPTKKKEFEASWSDQARLAQRQPGYEWTRTYKALDWEDSPFHYVSFRMWNEASSYRRMAQFDQTWKILSERVADSVTSRH